MQRMLELLRFRGRLSRMAYWRAYLWLTIVGVFAWAVGLFAILAFGRLGGVFMLPLIVVVVAAIATAARRLHDRNRSGWLLLLFVLFPVLAALWFETEGGKTASPWLVLALSLISLVVNIWGLVEIGFRRGTAGPNRFGDEPAVRT
jgi:uncharacterized membrane protein YhaH (DUF805 family)